MTAAGARRPGAPPDAPLVAVLEKRGRFLVAEPLFGHGPRTAVERGQAGPGDLVLVGSGKRGARVLRVLGRPDRARDVVEGLMLDRGLHRNYGRAGHGRGARTPRPSPMPPTRAWTSRGCPPSRSTPTTPRTSTTRSPPGARTAACALWVHIADVTAYLRPGGHLEREAMRRATSVYVPGAVEPMLPEVLSNQACSLRPGEEKLAVTVEMEMEGADVLKVAFHRSRMRSDARLTYGQVDEVFAGRERADEPWAGRSRSPREVARALHARRDSLAIGIAEPTFEFDSEGHVVGVRKEEQTESHRLIEALMVLANEQVAGYLEDRKLPTLYRVHERPEPRSVEFLADQLASLDIPTPAAAEEHDPAAGRGRGRRDVAHRGPRGARPARDRHARAARPEAGVLLAAQPRARRPGQRALHALHLADPALPGRGGAPRAAPGARHRRRGHARPPSSTSSACTPRRWSARP